MMRAPVVGLLSRPAAVLAASSPWPSRPSPSRLLSCATRFQSVSLLPRPKRQNAPRSLRYLFEKKKKRSGRVESVSSPHVDAQSPLSFVVKSSHLTAQFPLCKLRLCRTLARGGACLRARASRLCIAALPRLPKKDARVVGAHA